VQAADGVGLDRGQRARDEVDRLLDADRRIAERGGGERRLVDDHHQRRLRESPARRRHQRPHATAGGHVRRRERAPRGDTGGHEPDAQRDRPGALQLDRPAPPTFGEGVEEGDGGAERLHREVVGTVADVVGSDAVGIVDHQPPALVDGDPGHAPRALPQEALGGMQVGEGRSGGQAADGLEQQGGGGVDVGVGQAAARGGQPRAERVEVVHPSGPHCVPVGHSAPQVERRHKPPNRRAPVYRLGHAPIKSCTLCAVRGAWCLRVLWGLLAVAAGPAFGDALAGASRPVQVVASVGLWVGWAGTLTAMLVPRASTLTAVRIAAPAPLAASVVAALHGPRGIDDAVALGIGVAVVAVALLPETADAFVDGSSYGAERRFALRTPPGLLLGPAPVAWLLAVGAPVAAALLLAAEAWVVGAALAVVGAVGIRLGVPALHRLSRRWLVFVPAGLVVHDHLALADPVLLRRPTFARIGPAPVDALAAGAHDLTLGATGLALELTLEAPIEVGVAAGSGRRREAVPVRSARYLVTPLRPGAVLGEARARRYPVATAEPTTTSPS
jgi:hypothetical protein